MTKDKITELKEALKSPTYEKIDTFRSVEVKPIIMQAAQEYVELLPLLEELKPVEQQPDASGLGSFDISAHNRTIYQFKKIVNGGGE